MVAKNSVLKVRGFGLLRAYIYYPIRKDGRSTGFSSPTSATRPTAAWNLGTAFFWAMGRSLDQTFYADSFSKVGYGFGHELRYAADSPSRGVFRTYLFQYQGTPTILDPDTGEVVEEGTPANTDYDVDWNALHMLPGSVRATVNVRKYSNLSFNQRFQESFNRVTNRTEHWSAALEKDLRLAVLSASMDTTSTYFGTDFVRINGRLPGLSLRRFPRQVGWGGVVFGLLAAADRLQWGETDAVDHWTRFDFAPTVARPFRLSFLELNPSFGYRYTRYGASFGVNAEEQNAIVGPALNRSFFETQMEMRGRSSRASSTPRASATPSASSTRSGPSSPGRTARGSRTSTPSRSSTGTTTSSAPTRSPTRSSSASTRNAPGRPARPCPTSSSTGGSCRPTTSRSRTGRTTSTRTTRPPCSVPD